MPTPIEWLSGFRDNTGTTSPWSQSQPKILGLANGHIVVAWEAGADGSIGTSAGTDIVAKIYDAEGKVIRDAFQPNVFANDRNARDFNLTAGALWLQDFGDQTRVFGLEDNDDVIDFALWINDGAEVTVDHYIASDFPL